MVAATAAAVVHSVVVVAVVLGALCAVGEIYAVVGGTYAVVGEIYALVGDCFALVLETEFGTEIEENDSERQAWDNASVLRVGASVMLGLVRVERQRRLCQKEARSLAERL